MACVFIFDPCGFFCILLTYISLCYADYCVISFIVIPGFSDRCSIYSRYSCTFKILIEPLESPDNVTFSEALHKNCFPLRISSVNVTISAGSFTEEILNGKLHFLCSASGFCELTLLSFGHYSDHERGTNNETALFSDKV